jgi:N-acetylmuramate 1-kinase
MSDRAMAISAFLNRAGWGTADREHLAGDASDRSYLRLRRGDETAVLMDSPPGSTDDPASFVRIADHLAGLGLSSPRVLAQELAQGLLLLEDLGDAVFARLLTTDPAMELTLYTDATDVLLHLQGHPAPAALPDLSARDWATAAAFVLDWYTFGATGEKPDAAPFIETLTETLSRLADGPRVLILRDYHAENLLWLPARHGLARTGLLDFQLGQLGQPGYDLVSLLQDARRDVGDQTEQALTKHFAQQTGVDLAAFQASYAALGAQRALRILGVFARLCLVAGKPGYLPLIPRVWGQLQRNLTHPKLAQLRQICDAILPTPTPEALSRIKSRCNQFPTHS